MNQFLTRLTALLLLLSLVTGLAPIGIAADNSDIASPVASETSDESFSEADLSDTADASSAAEPPADNSSEEPEKLSEPTFSVRSTDCAPLDVVLSQWALDGTLLSAANAEALCRLVSQYVSTNFICTALTDTTASIDTVVQQHSGSSLELCQLMQRMLNAMRTIPVVTHIVRLTDTEPNENGVYPYHYILTAELSDGYGVIDLTHSAVLRIQSEPWLRETAEETGSCTLLAYIGKDETTLSIPDQVEADTVTAVGAYLFDQRKTLTEVNFSSAAHLTTISPDALSGSGVQTVTLRAGSPADTALSGTALTFNRLENTAAQSTPPVTDDTQSAQLDAETDAAASSSTPAAETSSAAPEQNASAQSEPDSAASSSTPAAETSSAAPEQNASAQSEPDSAASSSTPAAETSSAAPEQESTAFISAESEPDGSSLQTEAITEESDVSAQSPVSASLTTYAAAHSHRYILSKTVQPTLTSKGYYLYICSCGDSYKAEFTLNVGQSFYVGNFRYSISRKDATVAISGCSSRTIKSLTIPTTTTFGGVTYRVTAVATQGFTGFPKLTTVTFNSSVTTIGTNAFRGCKALKNLYTTQSISYINKCAFYGCTALRTVSFPNTAAVIIRSLAFSNCTSLDTVTFLSAAQTMDRAVFYGNKNLNNVYLASDVSSAAFVGSNAVTSSAPSIYSSASTMNSKLSSSTYSAFKKSYYSSLVLPGLKGAVTTRGYCPNMTPQGTCVSGTYVFVSAYCGCGMHKHKSVLFVLTRTGTFVKTVTLNTTGHVGGIAYDALRKVIWVCTTTSTTSGSCAAVAAYPLSAVLSGTTSSKTIYPSRTCPVGVTSASFLTICGSTLFVGYFNLLSKGKVLVYKISSALTLTKTKQFYVPAQTQGISFYYYKSRYYMMVSRSYGRYNKSTLFIYRFNGTTTNYTTSSKSYYKKYTFPAMLEQTYVYSNTLYTLFESAASTYRAQALNKMDRICALNLKILI